MRNSRLTRAGALLAAASLALAACADEESPQQPGGEMPGDEDREVASAACPGGGEEIKVGTKYDQPGLGQQTPDGFDGFDVAVACYIAKEIYGEDVSIDWVETPSAERENALEAGNVDMIAATYTINDERKERVDFVGPYFLAHQDLLVRADYDEITSEDDLGGADLKLCSVTGSTSAENVKNDFAPKADLVEQKGYSECLTSLENEVVDALTTDNTILAGLAAANPGKFKLVGLELSDEPYGIGLQKGSDMKADVAAAVEKMIADGDWAEFIETHLGPAGFEVPEAPELTEK